ncbi:MAG: adenosine deaminase, partial [Bacteroidota bacterium]
DCPSISVNEIRNDVVLFEQLIAEWSKKGYGNHYHADLSPDPLFFNTFTNFETASPEYLTSGLQALKERAINENVSYLESALGTIELDQTIFFPPRRAKALNDSLLAAKNQAEVDLILETIARNLIANGAYNEKLAEYVNKIKDIHVGLDEEDFILRFQTYGVRTLAPLQVFMQLMSGFLVTETSPLVVGVNLVGPENNRIALRDYSLHMQMFNFLHRKYPAVPRALHAGELTLGMVRPKDLSFHIHEAITVAKAQRIGHGVDLPHENDPFGLIEKLKTDSVVIEINLSSNKNSVGVMGEDHPYLIYKKYGIPMVISTNNSGVFRNNLSQQFMLLATQYQPSYAGLKRYVYNSIRYSFLSEEEKAKQKELLDEKFVVFEEKIAALQ